MKLGKPSLERRGLTDTLHQLKSPLRPQPLGRGVWGSGVRGSTAHQPGPLLWDPLPGEVEEEAGQHPGSHAHRGLHSTPLRQPGRLPFAC